MGKLFAAHFKAEIMLLLAAGKGEQHQAKAQLDAFLASPDLGHDPEPTHGLGFFSAGTFWNGPPDWPVNIGPV